MKKINNHVRFKGGGFKTEHTDKFEGRDLAEYIAEHFRQKGYVVNSVEYEELWFTINVVSGSIEYHLMVSHSVINKDYWEISCPRTLGFFDRICGKSEDVELQNITNTLDAILHQDEKITDIKWFSDYEDLTDDYVKKPAAKKLVTLYKYLEKVILPMCVTGWILALIGGISSGKDSILIRIGAIMFMLPIILWSCLFIANFVVALVYDIKGTHRERSKKKWLRWLTYCLIISAMVLPFILGVLHVPSVEKVMPTIQKIMFGAMALLLFCGMLFAMICGFTSDLQKRKQWRKKTLLWVGIICILSWIMGFFGGILASLGVLRWIPNSIEFPLALIKDIDVNTNGDLFVLSRFYSRIQVYDHNGDYIRGWFYYAPNGEVCLKITDENEIEVAAFALDQIYLFDQSGNLLETNKYEEIDSWYPSDDNTKHLVVKSTGIKYDVEGVVFPRIILTSPDGKKKIGKNAFYLFPFQGPAQAFALGFLGMFIVNKVDKKKKKKK